MCESGPKHVQKMYNQLMKQTRTLNNYKSKTKRTNMASSIQLVKDGGFGKYQKSEGKIACNYANADLAVKAMLKFVEKKANR